MIIIPGCPLSLTLKTPRNFCHHTTKTMVWNPQQPLGGLLRSRILVPQGEKEGPSKEREDLEGPKNGHEW
jgi:hypothetical protein